VEHSCKELVRILHEAEQNGSKPSVAEITSKITHLKEGMSVLAVFDKCKAKGWVGGSAWAPWLTEEGRKISCSDAVEGSRSSMQ
jgi:hypothetical protein